MIKKQIKTLKRRIPGYSLVEVSIVLLIVGIITAGALKGRSLLKSVRLDAVVSDIRSIQLAYNQYIDAYSAIPGNDKNITSVDKNISTGKGDGVFCKEDAERVFNHLQAVGLIKADDFSHPKAGNKYLVIENEQHPYIKLDGLSEDQITLLRTKLNLSLGQTTDIKSDKDSISVRIDQQD